MVLVDLASIGFSIPGSNDAHGPGPDLVVVDLPALHQIPRPGHLFDRDNHPQPVNLSTSYPLPTFIEQESNTNQTWIFLVHPPNLARNLCAPSIPAKIPGALPIHLVLHLHGNERRRSRPTPPPLSLVWLVCTWYGMVTFLCYYKLTYAIIS